MLTLQKTSGNEIASIPFKARSIEDLLSKEWLLTNNRGSYASSTIVGCNTRRYHGLLVGSLNPPVHRIMALAKCLEMLIVDRQSFNLSTFEFNDKFAPEGFRYIKKFSQDIGVHFSYQLDQLELTKSIYLLSDTDTVVLEYDFRRVAEPAEFILRPFVGLRDFHMLQKSYAQVYATLLDDGLLVRHNTPKSCELFLSCPAADFKSDQQWWFNFVYRNDKRRGQDFTEDLWTPGFFKCHIDSPVKVILWANLSRHYNHESLINTDIEIVKKNLRNRRDNLIAAAKNVKWNTKCELRDAGFRKLCSAADQFITKCPTDHSYRTTILAGFPWFADWGRDAFISLPGLLLLTGRVDEARSVLTTFADAADDGVIPNRFDDRSDTAYFNSVDTSLWFIHAAFQYLQLSGDSKNFASHLLPVIRWVVDSFRQGSRFGIHADCDGLITAGSDQTQLTWMDAKYDGCAFTPRYGKAVEVNALWFNCLCWLAQFYAGREIELAKHYHAMADKVKSSFCRLFWNQKSGCLYDCVLPDGSVDASLRPNQIFAVSLPFSPLSAQQQKSVVDAVQKNLLTPFGLRTLDARDSRYRGSYDGPQQQRDTAYHQGTVWPYLIGPFVEAYLKVNDFSKKSKKAAAEFIQPLMQHLTADGCIGQISEIFDGDRPHKPRGCIAQAWSVGELIRAYRLINS